MSCRSQEREAISDAIAEAEKALARLADEEAAQRRKLTDLRNRLVELSALASPVEPPPAKMLMNPDDKVGLGKSLKQPPQLLPSGWAAFLYLFELR